MGVKRPAGSAKIEAQIVEGWKRLAARLLGSADRAADGRCYLEADRCLYGPRSTFAERFAEDCLRCPRMRAAMERLAPEPAPARSSGAIPTLGLLLRLTEAQGSGSAGGAPHDRVVPAEEHDESRFRMASILLRALPLLHSAVGARSTARTLAGAIAGAFDGVIDTVLFFEVVPDGSSLQLLTAFRRADLAIPVRGPEVFLDVELLAAGGAFDSEVFEKLREKPLPLDADRDLLADAVFDGRTSLLGNPEKEFRLPTVLVDHLPAASAAILPVFGRERVRAVVVLGAAPGVSGWTSEQIELLTAVAAQAGNAIEGAGLAEVSRRRGVGLRGVQDVLLALQKPGAEAGIEAALRVLAESTESSHAIAWTRGRDGACAAAAIVGRPDIGESELREMAQTLTHWFEADPNPILIDAVAADPRLPGSLPESWGSALAVPLRTQGATWGGLLLVRENRAGAEPRALAFDTEDASLGVLVAAAASLGESRDSASDGANHVERKLRDAEAQIRHMEKLAVVGERGIQMAQEIRNPIAAISGFAKRVLKSLAPENENREYLEIILREADRLERVLGEQIALAQLTRPRLKLQSLNTVVQEALELQSEELVRRRVRLLKRLGPDLPSLLIDPDKIRHVLMNILHYALQSVPSGGRVRVETRSGPGVVHAEIAHDGPKVAGETLDRLFVPFSMSRRYGAGVGLAVAYQMVREHGGEIRARSEGDWSSIVTVYLPIRENQDRRARPDRRAGRNDRRRRLA